MPHVRQRPNGGADYLAWARHLGADGVLAKPFRMAELLKISRSVIATDPIHSTRKIEG